MTEKKYYDHHKQGTLRLVIKKYYFDLIRSGKKKIEYRDMTPYYFSRFEGRHYDQALFVNGYASDAPQFVIEIKKIVARDNWYEIHLGKLL